jgi:hypothetical protein
MRRHFSPDEMAAITREADDLWNEDRLGQPFKGEVTENVAPFVEKRPLLRQFAEDDRIYRIIEQLLGPEFIWSGSEGNLTVHSEHGWHADRQGEAELSYIRIKVMFYLDPVTKERGCLRVIPGSHRLPLHMDLAPLQAQQEDSNPMAFGVAGPDMPSFSLESEPGDVVFFNQSLYHAMFGGRVGRRLIALKYAAKPTTDEHIASLQRWSPYAFHPDEAFLNSNRPRLRGMVKPLVELGLK